MTELLKPEEVMAQFGYADRKSFLRFVKAQRVPHLRLNTRVIRFQPGPLEDWLRARRTIKLNPRTT